MFSVAALQSCTQKRIADSFAAIFRFAQTTIAAGALHLPYLSLERSIFIVSSSVIAMNSQGRLLLAEATCLQFPYQLFVW
jgi:hypothetical protein